MGAQIYQVLDPHSQLVATTVGGVLGLGFSVWSYFSDRRNKELFYSDDIVQKILVKVEQSPDYASFVFDLWSKHNLESSEERRLMLKEFLEKETNNTDNQFENFSRIAYIIQNANLTALRILSIIHSDVVQKREINPNNAADCMLSLKKLIPLIQSVSNIHEQDIEYYMNELSNFGLVSILHERLGGPFYIEAKLGYILIDYIRD